MELILTDSQNPYIVRGFLFMLNKCVGIFIIMKKIIRLNESELIDLVKKTINEEIDSEYDSCFEKSVKFYQSKEGVELLDLMRKEIDGRTLNPKIKLSREERRRLKYLLRLSPKC